MSIREEAEREAERRRPDIPADPPGTPGNEARFPTGYSYALERAMFVAGAVWAHEQDTQEPSEPVRVQIAPRRGGKHSTLADMIVERANARGVRVEFVAPDEEPSDAEVFAAVYAIHDHNAESLTCFDHDGTCCPCGSHDMGRGEWQVHRARAVLLATQEVRRNGGH